ncbi:MAG TPA: GNAT family N-acetyltransferase, partial [Phenylobacterium sp.]
MCALDVRPAVATERLLLRGPVADDVAAIAGLANDPGVAGMITKMPYPYGQADAEAFVDSVTRMNPRTDAHFAVEHREFGLIGMVGLHVTEAGRPELGYWFGRPFWGRGYATEAVTGALRWAGSDWRKNVVWAGHFADNPASGQVL